MASQIAQELTPNLASLKGLSESEMQNCKGALIWLEGGQPYQFVRQTTQN